MVCYSVFLNQGTVADLFNYEVDSGIKKEFSKEVIMFLNGG
jgi:hypothetical protein